MRKELISRAIGDLPDSYLKEAEQFEEEKKSRSGSRSDSPARSRWIRWGAVAACLVLLIGLGLSAVYVVAEAEEYKEAETFFLEHNLSTEGLTRSEVKAVYRDILTRSFSDEKTAEVLRTSIPGFLIEVAEPTPEELARFWDRNSSGPSAPAIESTGYRYTFDYQSPEDFDECTTVVTCSLDGTQCWKVAIPSCFLNGALHTGTGTILWGTDEDRVFGHNESPQSADDYPVTRARLILLDETGTIKNDMFLGNGIKYDLIDAVVDNSDGTVTVFSIVDFQDLFILKLRPDGSSVFSNKLSCPHGRISTAIRFGEGYFISIRNGLDPRHEQTLYHLNEFGEIDSQFRLDGEECRYSFDSLSEIGGKIYLSGYSYPKEGESGSRDEISGIVSLMNLDGTGIPWESEEFTNLVRNNYTAVLLICSPDGREPESFYQVPCAFGGEITTNEEGQLVWEVREIISSEFSPYTNAYVIYGTCRVLSLTLERDGKIVSEYDTGEAYHFGR